MKSLLKGFSRAKLEDYKILIVDDNPSNLSVVTDHLEGYGFSVLVSQDGESALKRAKYAQPDMILLDVMMPGIDGFETCRRLKADEKTKDIPVCFMTVLNETENIVQGFKAGAVDYISKPLRAEELIARVTTHLRLRELTENLEELVRKRTDELQKTTEQLKQEICERKRAEEALRKAERLFSYYVDNIDAYVYIKNKEGHFTFINKKTEERLNVTREELKNSAFTAFEIVDTEMARQTLENDQYVLETGQCLESEDVGYFLADDQSNTGVRSFFSLRFPLKDENGKVSGLCGFAYDNTKQKEAEKEKKQLMEHLQQAQKMEAIGTLAGGIAHDFNNILGIIIGNIDLAMYDIPEWNPARRHLKEVRTAGARAGDLVRQLLSFSRKTEQDKKPTQIKPIVKETLKLLRSSLPSSIEIRQNISGTIDNILADPTQIHQIIINLCTNASHAMPESGGVLEVLLQTVEVDESTQQDHHLPPGRYVNLQVKDNGCGIQPEFMPRIFEPYFTTKEVGKGTGMGLSVVHGIVENHHGKITVKSEPGEGTVFNVFFPAVDMDIVPDQYVPQTYSRGKERILFVDDEEFIVSFARTALEKLGYRVEGRTSSVEALDLFRSDPGQFDLIVTDMTMPHMSGERLIAEILKIKPDFPTILCTGYSEKINEISAKAIGIGKYLEKPFDISGLAGAVREVMDGRKTFSDRRF